MLASNYLPLYAISGMMSTLFLKILYRGESGYVKRFLSISVHKMPYKISISDHFRKSLCFLGRGETPMLYLGT